MEDRRSSGKFVRTPALDDMAKRAVTYLKSGLAVHFSGPAGVGKTSMALHVASLLGRPVVLLAGDEQIVTSDLVGGRTGYRLRRVVDNFVRSVLKTEDRLEEEWVDGKLALACKNGFTLVYDEFTRSRPEANNVLLSVLEEGVLLLTEDDRKGGEIKVAPEFRAIFTSNPLEYSGTHRSSDALLDRMITMRMSYPDHATEVLITKNVCGVDSETAEWIARLVEISRDGLAPSVSTRACIAIGSVMKRAGLTPDHGNRMLKDLCLEIIMSSRREVLPEQTTGFDYVWEESFRSYGSKGRERREGRG